MWCVCVWAVGGVIESKNATGGDGKNDDNGKYGGAFVMCVLCGLVPDDECDGERVTRAEKTRERARERQRGLIGAGGGCSEFVVVDHSLRMLAHTKQISKWCVVCYCVLASQGVRIYMGCVSSYPNACIVIQSPPCTYVIVLQDFHQERRERVCC